MKKLLSIILSVVMLMSAVSCLAVSAEETFPPVETGIYTHLELDNYSVKYSDKLPQTITPDAETAQKIEEFKQEFIKNHSYLESTDDIDVYYFGTLDDGSMLLYVPFGASLTAIEYVVIDKYVYINACLNDEVHICRNNKLLRVVDEYKAGNITDAQLDQIADILCYDEFVNPNETEPESTLPMYGDVYTDGKISVADATQIGKYLADLTTFTDEQKTLADFNGDGKIDVNDATDIQKKISDLKYKYTHELYEVEYSEFATEDLTAVPFNIDKKVNAEEYNSQTKDYYYFEYNSSLKTLFKTYDEYSRFFNATFEEYDQDFFEENSLIFLYAYRQTVSDYFTLDNVYVKDNILYLEITNWADNSEFVPDMFANWNQFITVNKADVENVEKICVKSSTSYYSN